MKRRNRGAEIVCVGKYEFVMSGPDASQPTAPLSPSIACHTPLPTFPARSSERFPCLDLLPSEIKHFSARFWSIRISFLAPKSMAFDAVWK
jgi:hypothetical protein